MATTGDFGSASGASRPARSAVGLAWLAMVALDFLLQGGLFAPLYDWGNQFLVSPGVAFQRIPLAYGGLALEALLLAWLMPRLGVRDAPTGARRAVITGALAAGGFLAGLASIATVPAILISAWWIALVTEFAAAGWVLGASIAGVPTRTLGVRVVVLAVACAGVTIALQSFGYAPSASLRP